MLLPSTSPERKFPDEYSRVIFIQVDHHLKKLLQKYKRVPILWITVYMYRYMQTKGSSNGPWLMQLAELAMSGVSCSMNWQVLSEGKVHYQCGHMSLECVECQWLHRSRWICTHTRVTNMWLILSVLNYWSLKRRNSRQLHKWKERASLSGKQRVAQSVVRWKFRRVEWMWCWTRPRRCRRQGRSSWRWVECRVRWTGRSCQKEKSTTSVDTWV